MLLLLAIAGGFISVYLLWQSLRPLTERGVVTADDWERVEDESLDLLQRRDRLLSELRDLEFEASLDKISGADLEEMRARFAGEALALDKAIEAQASAYQPSIDAAVDRSLRGQQGAQGDPEPQPSTSASAEGIRAMAAAPAADPRPAPAPGPDAALQCGACGTPHARDALFCDGCGAALGPKCSSCGAPNRAGAQFCKQCGHGLAAPAEGAA